MAQKHRVNAFMIGGAIGGETPGTALRVISGKSTTTGSIRDAATRHKIPPAVLENGWKDSIARVEGGEDLPSESETEQKPAKAKAKKRGRSCARSLSKIQAESSDESDSSGGAISGKQEPDTESSHAVQRRSSRLSHKKRKK
ncbi:hypothetical protein C8R44DRAFT_736878 [Mycena epipterygia]|nr:hypothetical protein C8R44DRAFT_736878 [Mycena epipterygia]